MTEEQACALAAQIKTQFPFHVITVVQSADMRNAPRNWILGIRPSEDYTGRSLLIHSEFEWNDALLAWRILKDSELSSHQCRSGQAAYGD